MEVEFDINSVHVLPDKKYECKLGLKLGLLWSVSSVLFSFSF